MTLCLDQTQCIINWYIGTHQSQVFEGTPEILELVDLSPPKVNLGKTKIILNGPLSALVQPATFITVSMSQRQEQQLLFKMGWISTSLLSAADTAADRVLCQVNTEVSMPASNNKAFFY